MTFIGVDPGPRKSGAAIVDVDFGLIWMAHDSNKEIIKTIKPYLEQGNAVLGYEWVQNYGRVVGETVMRTAHTCGRLFELAHDKNNFIHEPTRPKIVRHFTGKTNSKKPEVRDKILERFGGEDSKKKGGALYGISNHKWDALAVCIYLGETIYDIDRLFWTEQSWSSL